MIERLLVIRLSAMGDVAMTLPVIAGLASSNPNVKITVLSRDFLRPIFEKLPENVEFIGFDAKGKHKDFKGLNELYKELKSRKFDAVADLHNVIRTKYLRLRFALNGVKVAHIDKGRKEKKELISHKSFKQLKTTVQRYRDVFEKLGLRVEGDFSSIYGNSKPSLVDIAPLFGIVSVKPEGERWIGIAPFAAHKGKAYPVELMHECVKMVAASGSTLFMDEIGNLPLHLQAKMLVALQNRMVTPLGGNTPQPIDIRVVAATNRDIYSMVDSGGFRQDLLYRINTVHINLPPLRNRQVDIIPLAGIFLKHYCEKYGKEPIGISQETAEKLMAHPFEGNIRELQNIMEKAVIMCDGAFVEPVHLQLHVSPAAARSTGSTLENLERDAIVEAMSSCGGNMSMVAQKLGITRQTLYNKIKRYGL